MMPILRRLESHNCTLDDVVTSATKEGVILALRNMARAMYPLWDDAPSDFIAWLNKPQPRQSLQYFFALLLVVPFVSSIRFREGEPGLGQRFEALIAALQTEEHIQDKFTKVLSRADRQGMWRLMHEMLWYIVYVGICTWDSDMEALSRVASPAMMHSDHMLNWLHDYLRYHVFTYFPGIMALEADLFDDIEDILEGNPLSLRRRPPVSAIRAAWMGAVYRGGAHRRFVAAKAAAPGSLGPRGKRVKPDAS
jgi:hypothetical protein